MQNILQYTAHAWNPPSGCREMRLSSFPDWSRLKLKLGLLAACPSLTRTQIFSPITNLPKCSCLSQKWQTPESSVDPAFSFQTKPFSCLPWFFFLFFFWSYVSFCTVFLDSCHHKSFVAPAEKRRLVIEGEKHTAVHFSLLCFLQYSNSLVLRGALPAFNTSCCKWFSVPRCRRLRQKCTCDRCQISGGTRRILDLTSVHQHPEPLPLPPGVKWLGNSWYKSTAGKSTEWEYGPTGRCILDGVQSSCNVSPDQQHISWMSTSLNKNCINS